MAKEHVYAEHGMDCEVTLDWSAFDAAVKEREST
jgi:hypothetical protein